MEGEAGAGCEFEAELELMMRIPLQNLTLQPTSWPHPQLEVSRFPLVVVVDDDDDSVAARSAL